MKLEHSLIGMVTWKCLLKFANKDIIVCWVPSPVGIRSMVMKRQTQCCQVYSVFAPYTEFKHHICRYVFITWQNDWNGAIVNMFHSVNPSSYRWCRKDETVLCHIHVSHSHFTHKHILKKYPSPQWEHCQCILTHLAQRKIYLTEEI